MTRYNNKCGTMRMKTTGLLEKENIFVSVSTVGRVLKYLMEQKKYKYNF